MVARMNTPPEKESRARINKGIRYSEDELALADALVENLPEFDTQSDVLRQASILGMLVMATRVSNGLPRFANRRLPDDLAELLRPLLLPALDFLAERRALPVMYAPGFPPGAGNPYLLADPEPEQLNAASVFDQGANDYLDDMGVDEL
jgi:hypothetical protein